MGPLARKLFTSGAGLHETVLNDIRVNPKGRILDVGTGKGGLALRLHDLGYDVSACDINSEPPWEKHFTIDYLQCDLNFGIPFRDESFDYVTCLEVISLLQNPFAICRELKRVLRPGGILLISSANILRMRSRIKFLLEGTYPSFDLPPIESDRAGGGSLVTINPIRLHELEYYLYKAGFEIVSVFASERCYKWRLFLPLEWLVRIRAWSAERRIWRRKGIPLARLHSRILTSNLLYGKHVIIRAKHS